MMKSATPTDKLSTKDNPSGRKPTELEKQCPADVVFSKTIPDENDTAFYSERNEAAEQSVENSTTVSTSTSLTPAIKELSATDTAVKEVAAQEISYPAEITSSKEAQVSVSNNPGETTSTQQEKMPKTEN